MFHPLLILFAVLFLLDGLLLIGVSLPLIGRRVKPNPVYGFRVPKTLNDPNVWYAANAYAGRMLLLAGVVTALAAVALVFVPGITFLSYAVAGGAVCVTSVLLATWISFRYLNTL